MTDLIRKDDLMAVFNKFRPYMAVSVGSFAKALGELPTVDAEPVRHGKWLCTDDLYEIAYCSECKYDADEPWGLVIERLKYCPNCGAKMGAKRKE